MYSHDSFGLGHLRRCMAIANRLVAKHKGLSVLILSGSPIIGSFNFRARVDFVRVPGMIKLRNGEYTSLNLHISPDQTLQLRRDIIYHTAHAFDPNLFIVDKEPLGLQGEVGDTLKMLKNRGTSLVLGLRDVMDDPHLLAAEWSRKRAIPALADLYDEIWIYGLEDIYDPLTGIDVPETVHGKIAYTGYLRKNLPHARPQARPEDLMDDPYILVTPGGGGDGEALVDWVLRAYEYDRTLPYPALVVFGPFMAPRNRERFSERIKKLDRVRAITFNTGFESLMAKSMGVVAMGGYNTFCEILSFDRPALLVPRTVPRREQMIRAERAARFGLTQLLGDDGHHDPRPMAEALRALADQPRPSLVNFPGLLDGLEVVDDLATDLLERPAAAIRTIV
jgi:predicted glycosyltransferase